MTMMTKVRGSSDSRLIRKEGSNYMEKVKIIEAKESLLEDNDKDADRLRETLREEKTYYINIMSSPGSGKTSSLRQIIGRLKEDFRIGVMEADIDSDVDAKAIASMGTPAIQIHTGGMCHLDADMSRQGLKEIESKDLDLVFLENVGNLVCPAENDTGASVNVEILSVPEGDDKPLKYPLMFQVCQAVLINKIDTRKFFPFDDQAVVERIHALNPAAKVFFLSAKTGEGFDQWTKWLKEQISAWQSA